MNINLQSKNPMQGQNQNQGTQGAQGTMAMLSSKNLSILDDQLGKEALNYKKMNLYSDSCTDQQLKSLCQKTAQMHKKHFDTLYSYLNSHNKPMQMQ